MLFNLLNSATSVGVHIKKKASFKDVWLITFLLGRSCKYVIFFLVHINNNAIILNVVACIIYANI